MAARILIVEDNPANLELMVYLLRASGYQILVARDGEEGLQRLNSERPDLVICDVQMPGKNGHEVAQEAKQDPTLRHIPLIAVTAFARTSDHAKALAAGFDGYLAKPIDPEAFVRQVEAFLKPEWRLAAPAASPSSAEPISRRRARTLTVLVVDNLQANLDLSASLVEYSGCTAITAQDAHEALSLARRNPPDLILSDVCMTQDGGDDRSGYALIKEIKSDPRLASIPFIFMTSTAATEKERQHGLSLGAAKFLFRPMEPQQLLKELEEYLAGKRDR